MKKKAYLHELIALAKEGKKFSVRHPTSNRIFNQDEFNYNNSWVNDSITMPWTDYKETKEPIVIWVNVYPTYNECYDLKETDEYHANDSAIRKAVKFIEVI